VSQIAVQTAHAAGESPPEPPPSGTRVVVLAADDEAHLLKGQRSLERRGIAHTLIREPDTPWNNTATAIGVVPVMDRRPVRRALSSFQLLKSSTYEGGGASS